MSCKLTCRLCGSLKDACDITSNMNCIEELDLPLRYYVSFYCHLTMSSDPSLPQSVCRVCRSIIETFVAFCGNLLKIEARLTSGFKPPDIPSVAETTNLVYQAREPNLSILSNVSMTPTELNVDDQDSGIPEEKPENIEGIDLSEVTDPQGDPSEGYQWPPSEVQTERFDQDNDSVDPSEVVTAQYNDGNTQQPIPETSATATAPGQPKKDPRFEVISYLRPYRRRERSIDNVADIYSTLMTEPLHEMRGCDHISVSRKLIHKDGEVHKHWLAKYKVQTWKDFEYKCGSGCGNKFLSLSGLLEHLKKYPIKERVILCNICKKPFSTLNAYINHMTGSHKLRHLTYTCICCSKIFYNIAYLVKHYVMEHSRCPNIYPCLTCGTYTANLLKMRHHMLTHKVQMVSDSEGEDNEPMAKRRRASQMRTVDESAT